MKLDDVVITNWTEPGDKYWENVRNNPKEPLIEAAIKMTLSWEEYAELLEKNRKITTKAPSQT